MTYPPSVSYGPPGSRTAVCAWNSSRLTSPSTSTSPAITRTASPLSSYSSRMSPTSSSTRSSSVTMPSVPPYSSTTMARWWPSSRISASVASTRLLAGTSLTGRIGTTSLIGSSRPVLTGSSRSRTWTNPMTSS